MKRLIPVLLAIVGLAIGTGAGLFLKPVDSPKTGGEKPIVDNPAPQSGKDTPGAPKDSKTSNSNADGTPPPEKPGAEGGNGGAAGAKKEYVKLNNQFIVPVIGNSKVASLVVMSLSLEVSAGGNEAVFNVEPKLRDAFLQVLFNHANSGGFDGAFTSGEKMNDLRASLFTAAKNILGPIVSDVLVTDIVRQDV